MPHVPVELGVVAIIWVILVGFGIVERLLHDRALAKTSIRVHVNGTRGKTSVTRLIAAGLRASGKRVCAKTSGSFAAIVDPEGREYPIYRVSQPNIIEQVRVIDRLVKARPEVLVIECMALQPHFQAITELQMVRSTHGVITNARADHLDVMGPTAHDVALALAGTTPVDASIFTTERDHLEVLREAAQDRGSTLHEVSEDEIANIDEADVARFRYAEHRENIALALRVCEALDVPRDVAIEGMVALAPEAGATRIARLEFFGREILFVNAFAANDPASTGLIWERMVARHADGRRKVAIINCRIDRPDRSRQLAESAATWTPADAYVVIGSATMLFVRRAVAEGIPAHSITMLEGAGTDEVFEVVLDVCGDRALVVGMCNIHGGGYELARFFQNRSDHSEAL